MLTPLILSLLVAFSVGSDTEAVSWRSFGAGSACGNWAAASSSATRTAPSVQECQKLCEQSVDRFCKAVEFHHVEGRCELLSEAVQYTRVSTGSECMSMTGPKHVDVFVMLPLGAISPFGSIADPTGLSHQFDSLQNISVDGFMVDVWWGLTEPAPKAYNFSAYRQLFQMAQQRGWKVQVVASFHQCGGNVGDDCDIPLPDFVLKAEGVWYKDAHGVETKEYISLFADDVPIGSRTPLEMYKDWLEAFSSEFSSDLGGLIAVVMVGLGPAGELRYPSYPPGRGWKFCGLGEFQAYDEHALSSLRSAAVAASQDDWAAPPNTSSAGGYNSRPEETEFFTVGFRTDYGKFFLDWYSSALKLHGKRVLAVAKEAFQHKARISGKVSGVHWWYDSESHAAEVTAGYYNTNFRNAYDEIAKVFAEQGATLDFTCLEMRNSEQPAECRSNPQGLVEQVIQATTSNGVPLSGENALQRYDSWAYEQMESYRANVEAITYLRLTPELVKRDNLARFGTFVAAMHGTPHAAALASAADKAAALARLRR